MIRYVIFAIAVIADLALITGLVISSVVPGRRVWPIGESTWRWWFNWTALTIVFVAFPALAYLDWGTFIFTGDPMTLIGALLSVTGMGAALLAVFELGWTESSGKPGDLRTGGFYKYSRNPQTTCFILFIAGSVLLVNSKLLFIHGALTVVVYGLFPFAEEPWLREQYGDDYVAYCEETPRFVGWSSLQTLIEEQAN